MDYHLLPQFRPARLQDLILWYELWSFRGRAWRNLAPCYSDKNHGRAYGGVGLSTWHPQFPPAPRFDGVNDYCYDETTEILTLGGWMPFKNLTTNDFVATLNPETNELIYQKPKRLISYCYEGEMIKVQGRHIDLLVTPNHRMFVSVNKGANIWSEYKLLPAEEILDKKVKYKKDCMWKGQRVEFFELPSVIYKINQHKSQTMKKIRIPMNDWLEFFGYYISEGYCKYDEKKSEYSVVIAQNLEKKEKIEKCLKRLPFKFSYKKGKFYICNKQLASYLRQFGKAEDKFIPFWIKQLSLDQLKILLGALMYGDGHRNQYYTKSKKLADDIQEIVFKIGFSADVSYWTNRKFPIYCVGVQKTNIHPTVGERRNGIRWNLAKHKLVDYDGMVYCCEVPKYHIIYVRRNGKAVWSGNCEVPDSDSLNITDEITIEAWVKSNTKCGFFVKKYESKGYVFGHNSNNEKYFFLVVDDAGDKHSCASNINIQYGKLTHVVGVFKAYSYQRIYVNVNLDKHVDATWNLRSDSANLLIGFKDWMIGCGNYFDGIIPLVRIYKVALAPAEIRHNYTHHPLYFLQRGIDPYMFVKKGGIYYVM